ncbi:hypothetical protein PG985_007889 [Apiospora marii]|uniref:Uncharacterized protein n=1 Tax=Apiospora marii TaxID=335849 RepID=A0ABR1R8V9_9PEZI
MPMQLRLRDSFAHRGPGVPGVLDRDKNDRAICQPEDGIFGATLNMESVWPNGSCWSFEQVARCCMSKGRGFALSSMIILGHGGSCTRATLTQPLALIGQTSLPTTSTPASSTASIAEQPSRVGAGASEVTAAPRKTVANVLRSDLELEICSCRPSKAREGRRVDTESTSSGSLQGDRPKPRPGSPSPDQPWRVEAVFLSQVDCLCSGSWSESMRAAPLKRRSNDLARPHGALVQGMEGAPGIECPKLSGVLRLLHGRDGVQHVTAAVLEACRCGFTYVAGGCKGLCIILKWCLTVQKVFNPYLTVDVAAPTFRQSLQEGHTSTGTETPEQSRSSIDVPADTPGPHKLPSGGHQDREPVERNSATASGLERTMMEIGLSNHRHQKCPFVTKAQDGRVHWSERAEPDILAVLEPVPAMLQVGGPLARPGRTRNLDLARKGKSGRALH